MSEAIESIIILASIIILIWKSLIILSGVEGFALSKSTGPYLTGLLIGLLCPIFLGFIFSITENNSAYAYVGILLGIFLAPFTGSMFVEGHWFNWRRNILWTGAIIGFFVGIFLSSIIQFPDWVLCLSLPLFTIGGAFAFWVFYGYSYPILWGVNSTILLWASARTLINPQWILALTELFSGNSSVLVEELSDYVIESIVIFLMCVAFVSYSMWIQRFPKAFRANMEFTELTPATPIELVKTATQRIRNTVSGMFRIQRTDILLMHSPDSDFIGGNLVPKYNKLAVSLSNKVEVEPQFEIAPPSNSLPHPPPLPGVITPAELSLVTFAEHLKAPKDPEAITAEEHYRAFYEDNAKPIGGTQGHSDDSQIHDNGVVVISGPGSYDYPANSRLGLIPTAIVDFPLSIVDRIIYSWIFSWGVKLNESKIEDRLEKRLSPSKFLWSIFEWRVEVDVKQLKRGEYDSQSIEKLTEMAKDRGLLERIGPFQRKGKYYLIWELRMNDYNSLMTYNERKALHHYRGLMECLSFPYPSQPGQGRDTNCDCLTVYDFKTFLHSNGIEVDFLSIRSKEIIEKIHFLYKDYDSMSAGGLMHHLKEKGMDRNGSRYQLIKRLRDYDEMQNI